MGRESWVEWKMQTVSDLQVLETRGWRASQKTRMVVCMSAVSRWWRRVGLIVAVGIAEWTWPAW